MNKTEAAALLSMVSLIIPTLQEKELKSTARAWAMFMPDIPFTLAKEALIRILRRKTISAIPIPGEIIKEVREAERDADTPPSAIDAWEEVREKIIFLWFYVLRLYF